MQRKLLIGGIQKAPGWEVLNIIPGAHVDHVGDAKDLSHYPDNTFTEIYASHVLEHFDYMGVLLSVLKEWYRVLKPGGSIYISIPNLDILAKLFLSRDQLNFNERFHVMRMIFGGHVDQYDYHVVGLNQEFLEFFLTEADFINIRRVDNFSLFNDTSSMLFKGVPISLNMIAEKPDHNLPLKSNAQIDAGYR